MARLVLFAFAGIGLLPFSVFSQLQANLESVFNEYDLMGMSVVTLCDGEINNSYHYGFRDYERNLPVNENTLYRIASISKLVTAIGLMKLWDQGMFNLDEDVSDALGFSLRSPDFPEVAITYRMLLSHRAGLQDGAGYNGFLSDTYSLISPPPLSELLLPGGDYFSDNMWRQESPGSYFAYSNIAYGVIGTLIEALSGMRFDTYMSSEVLEPLGISGSFNPADLSSIDDVAVLYRFQGGMWNPQADQYEGITPPQPVLDDYEPGTNGLRFAPQGGLRCSAEDLARIAIMLCQQGIHDGAVFLSSESVSAMLADTWTWNGGNGDNYYGLFRSWGLGVHRVTNSPNGDIVFPDVPVFGHPGEAYGLISDLYFSPESCNGLIFITNGAMNGYSFGDYSAFYRVEEEIFDVVNSAGIPQCVTDIQAVSEPGFHLPFPNPFSSGFRLNPNGTPFEWRVLSLTGELLLQGRFDASEPVTEVSTSDLESGVYLLEVSDDSTFMRSRIIKQ